MDDKLTTASAVVKSNLLRGMKIRDEFICPITYELMREPVVASDGHTYEKHAIEKWLKSNFTSPRSGEPMEPLLIPNMNLKKLIQDIINEGGAGFYTNDIANQDRVFEVCPEQVLILECLGPPESEWNQQSFQVTKYGCVGGRKHHVDDTGNMKEWVLFKDITVSRRHFEIMQVDEGSKGKNFSIRDLGSAGGTFIRIKYGTKRQLHPGMIILLGKHQFTVSSIDDGANDNNAITASNSAAIPRRSILISNNSRKSLINPEMISSIVENAERIIADISRDGHEDRRQKDELSARLKNLTEELHNLNYDENGDEVVAIRNPLQASDAKQATGTSEGESEKQRATEGKSAFQLRDLNATLNQLNLDEADMKDIKACATPHENNIHSSRFFSADSKKEKSYHQHTSSLQDEQVLDDLKALSMNMNNSNCKPRRCILTCCAPDGSPLQGKSFVVGTEGAMMGRKHTNQIALYMKITDANGDERITTVDTAISSEHARIEYDASTGCFFVNDGTPQKASTNGTWFRLSGPHQESPPHLLHAGAEVLIGTVRFLVKESMTISERKITTEEK